MIASTKARAGVSLAALATLLLASEVNAQDGSKGRSTIDAVTRTPVIPTLEKNEETKKPSGAAYSTPYSATIPAPQDIIVTAQRRAASIQAVPVAVSAFGSANREKLGIRSIQDLVNFTPGASLSITGLSIRGIGRTTTVLGSDAGVAIYTDGFYSSDPTILGQDTLFVDRVEILRGPQGTLFGRNSIGGSANVISRAPSSSPGGEFRVTLGNYDTTNAGGTFTGPITDTLRFRVSGEKAIQRDGYIRNVVPGKGDLVDNNSLYVEGQLEWEPSTNFDAWVKYSHYEYDNAPSLVTSQVLTTPYFNGQFFPAGSLVPNAQYDLQQQNPSVNDIHHVALDDPGRSTLKGENRVIGHLTWRLGSLSLKYVGGFEVGRTFAQGDYDATARSSYVVSATGPDPTQPPVGTPVSSRYLYTTGQDTKYFSHELTLDSDNTGPFKWIVGGNYYNENLKQPYALSAPDITQLSQPIYGVPPYAPAPPNPDRDFYRQYGTLKTHSIGGFAQASYRLSEQFEVEAGARYTHDHKVGTEDIRYVSYNPNVAGLLSPSCCSFEATPPVSFRRLDDSWSGLTGRVALDWKPDRDTLAYVSYSRGYKSGGFQLGQLAAGAEVAPEHVNTFEIGVKKTIGKFRIDSAVFYNDYRNFQVPITVLAEGGSAGLITQSQFVNAPRARSYGVELEMTWQAARELQLVLNYSYLNAKSTRFNGVFDITNPSAGNQNLSGDDLPQSPRNKMAASAAYTLPFSFGNFVLAATDSYVSKQYYSPFTLARYAGAAYNIVDVTLTYYDKHDRYEIAGYVRNIGNTNYIYGLLLGPATTGSPRSVAPGDPRTFGGEIRFKF